MKEPPRSDDFSHDDTMPSSQQYLDRLLERSRLLSNTDPSLPVPSHLNPFFMQDQGIHMMPTASASNPFSYVPMPELDFQEMALSSGRTRSPSSSQSNSPIHSVGDAERKVQRRTTSTQPQSKRFFCDVPGCNKSYYTSGHLQRHVQSHSGEKPYACTIEGCQSRFTRHDNCLQHIRAHQKKKEARISWPTSSKLTSPRPANKKRSSSESPDRGARPPTVRRSTFSGSRPPIVASPQSELAPASSSSDLDYNFPPASDPNLLLLQPTAVRPASPRRRNRPSASSFVNQQQHNAYSTLPHGHPLGPPPIYPSSSLAPQFYTSTLSAAQGSSSLDPFPYLSSSASWYMPTSLPQTQPLSHESTFLLPPTFAPYSAFPPTAKPYGDPASGMWYPPEIPLQPFTPPFAPSAGGVSRSSVVEPSEATTPPSSSLILADMTDVTYDETAADAEIKVEPISDLSTDSAEGQNWSSRHGTLQNWEF